MAVDPSYNYKPFIILQVLPRRVKCPLQDSTLQLYHFWYSRRKRVDSSHKAREASERDQTKDCRSDSQRYGGEKHSQPTSEHYDHSCPQYTDVPVELFRQCKYRAEGSLALQPTGKE